MSTKAMSTTEREQPARQGLVRIALTPGPNPGLALDAAPSAPDPRLGQAFAEAIAALERKGAPIAETVRRRYERKCEIHHDDRRVLEDLVRLGLLPESRVKLVLDVAAVAEDPHHVQSFATAITSLLAHGVPVEKTIRMAAAYQFPVSLRWTVERWWITHSKFSRAPTLWRVANNPAAHASIAGWVRDHLPTDRERRRHITVIDSLNRLAREEFRQRAPLSDLEGGFVNGTRGGMSVLIGGKRWTVLVAAPGARGRRPEVLRIFGAGGARPSGAKRNEILAVLGRGFEPRSRSVRNAEWRSAIIGTQTVLIAALALMPQYAYWLAAIPPGWPLSIGAGCYTLRRVARAEGWGRIGGCALALLWGVPLGGLLATTGYFGLPGLRAIPFVPLFVSGCAGAAALVWGIPATRWLLRRLRDRGSKR